MADDYLPKTASSRELSARIKARALCKDQVKQGVIAHFPA
jgi:DNA-binding response OmpR family regulator